jgi:hypothetical protein
MALPKFTNQVDRVRESWGKYEKEIPVVPLEEALPGIWAGQMVPPGGKGAISLKYDSRQGLNFVK